MSLRPTREDWALAARDLFRGLSAYNLWLLLGFNDIRQRYNRSKLGQFWITLSMGIFISGIGVVYSVLFNQPIREYIPYVAVNITTWTLISGIVGESPNVFTQSSIYIRQDAVAKTVFVMRLLVRNVIILGHNLIIIPITFLSFLIVPSPVILLFIPGLVVVLAAMFFLIVILGTLSTRFRDLSQIIQNALQLLFFVTPIMWRANQMTNGHEGFVLWNPFAALLGIVADPILGHVPSLRTYGVAGLTFAVLAALALPLFARFRARLVYWL